MQPGPKSHRNLPAKRKMSPISKAIKTARSLTDYLSRIEMKTSGSQTIKIWGDVNVGGDMNIVQNMNIETVQPIHARSGSPNSAQKTYKK